MLSRIDDVSSVDDIAMMVGVKLPDLMSILDRLADLGAVELSWRPAKSKSAEPPAKTPSSGAKQAEPTPKAAESSRAADAAEAGGLRGEAHPAVQRALAPPPIQPYTEGELDEPGDLNEMQKRRVLVAFYGLDGKSYYELLGVDSNADKKAIRSAYFELSRLFHPDSMFGRDLGSFGFKMEAVFKRLTEAYEVLGRSQRRKEYDEYLASTMSTSALQHSFDRVESQVRALSTAPPDERGRTPTPPRQPLRPASAPVQVATPVASPAPKTPTPAPAAAADPRRSQVAQRPPVSVEDRKAQARDRLRRSLAGGSQIGTNTPSTVSRTAPSSQPAAAASSDRVSSTGRQSAVGTGGVEAVMAYLRRARDAEAAGDLLSAAAALQAALALEPEHKDLQAQYARVSGAVTRKLADNYEKQARYEEKQGKWAAAALSWERVSDGRPESAEAARAVAESLLRASGDLAKAQRFATRAVDLTPHDAASVVVLARVFVAAGMQSQARRELEKAVKLDPHNAMIKDLLREVR